MYSNKSELNFTDIMSDEIVVKNFNYSDESIEMLSFNNSSIDSYSYNESPKTPRSHMFDEPHYLNTNSCTDNLGYFEEILLREEKKYKKYKNSIKIKKSKGFLGRIKKAFFSVVK